MQANRSNQSYWHPAWVIARNTYKEIIRDRLLYGIFLAALLVSGSSFFLATISLEQNSRILQNVGLSGIHLFTMFICIFTATNTMHKDFDRRAFYLLFSKPISRGQYVLGKFLGIILLLLTANLVLGGLFLGGLALAGQMIWGGALLSLAYSFLEVALLSALAVMFACFTAPLNAALYSFGLFIIGHSMDLLKQQAVETGSKAAIWPISFFYYTLPNLEKFNIRGPVLYNLDIPLQHSLLALAYFLIYTLASLILAVYVLNKREV